LVHAVDLALQPVDLRLDDAERHVSWREIVAGSGEVGSEVEHLVLYARKHRPRFRVIHVEDSDADDAVGLIHIADRLDPRIGLGQARAVSKAGLPRIAGSRVDFGELDQLLRSAAAREDQEQDHEDDRQRLKHDALAHQVLRPLAAKVLALRHADNALDKDEQGRAGRQHDEDDEERFHGPYLSARRRISSGRSSGAKVGDELAGIDAGGPQVGECWRSVALGEPLAVGTEQQVMMVIVRRG